jgi:uncharacterized cupredoxin-like copper-binding protein
MTVDAENFKAFIDKASTHGRKFKNRDHCKVYRKKNMLKAGASAKYTGTFPGKLDYGMFCKVC